MHKGFDPVVFCDSEILILGSFPSVKSREEGFYYGNKTNRFWKTLSQAFNEPLLVNINEKIDFLKKHRIALWDVAYRCDIQGSSDSNIKKGKYELAAVNQLIGAHSFKKIICNGKKAYQLFSENFITEVPVFCLPSTSSANVKFNKEAWILALCD